MASDAIAVLSADQNALIHLFSAYDRLIAADGTDDERAELARHICRQASTYIQLGEEVFHPAARPAIEDEEHLALASANQQDARDLILKVSAMSPEDSFYDAWVALLGCCMRQLIERDQWAIFSNLDPAKVRISEGIDRGSLDS